MAVVRRTSVLPIGADQAFALAQEVELFQFVVAPVLRMRSVEMPDRLSPGATIGGRLWWFGLVPSWRHHITIVAIDDHEISTDEHGGPVRTWNHRLTFEPLADGQCRYTDEIELGDGLRDLATRTFARLMFRHRHRRWATIAGLLAVPAEPADQPGSGHGSDRRMPLRVETVTIDARDPARLARWWAELLGATARPDDEDDSDWVVAAGGCTLLFGLDPETKVVKNRVHLDLRPDDRDAQVARAEALGATRVDIGQGDQTWVVLADPEGNEFCILHGPPAWATDDRHGT